MSGGSYNYIYARLKEECENYMYDTDLNEMIPDLCKVLRELEWWQSCDTSEEQYRDEVSRFKKKWLNKDSAMIDKIRAEIKEESRFCPLTEGLERALEIIDKCMAESEG